MEKGFTEPSVGNTQVKEIKKRESSDVTEGAYIKINN